MIPHTIRCILPLSLLLACGLALAEPSAAGHWTQFDDRDGKPRSIVRIDETAGGFEGHVEQVFPRPGDDPEPVCKQCTDSRRGQKVVGMKFIAGLQREGLDYTGGEILDPANGKVYRARMTLSADGNTLTVRGFVGISLLGRSQIWTRLR